MNKQTAKELKGLQQANKAIAKERDNYHFLVTEYMNQTNDLKGRLKDNNRVIKGLEKKVDGLEKYIQNTTK